MAIPDYQTIMLPLLKYAADNQEYFLREAVDYLAGEFDLSEEERKELLPSGKQKLFNNRVAWALTYIRKAGLVGSPKRGIFTVTERGQQVLSQNIKKIDIKFLNQFPEFVEFRKPKKKSPKAPSVIKPLPDDKNPEETLEAAFQELQEGIAIELLQTVKKCDPDFFEGWLSMF